MRGMSTENSTVFTAPMFEALEDQFEPTSMESSRCPSVDGLSSVEALSLSFGDALSVTGSQRLDCGLENGSTCSTNGSSPLGCPTKCTMKYFQNHLPHQLSGPKVSFVGGKTIIHGNGSGLVSNAGPWEHKRSEGLSEIDMMKEKYAKLLLGEDMSGGGKGVCSALAISNAITNLSATVFGEHWRLEPLAIERKVMWQREMDWLLAVADHIVELVPSSQTFPDGSSIEVMVSQPRSDLHANLPALRKLDAMLLALLESFGDAEFWYVDHGIGIADENTQNVNALQRQAEKWWLPSPKVPFSGLSEKARKHLQHERECVSQILKASVTINSQVLSEMDVPDAYWNALPKSGRASLGDCLYRHITSDCFSLEAVLSSLDLSSELKAVDVANHLEAAIHVWRGQRASQNGPTLTKSHRQGSKSSWNMMKDLVSDMDRRELLAGRAETLLLGLKGKVPSLRQTVLDMTKIQCNKDVGQSILESYSRILESLAFNILSRIDDILCVDDTIRPTLPAHPPAVKTPSLLTQRWGFSRDLLVRKPFGTLHGNSSLTPSSSPKRILSSPYCHVQKCQMLSSNFNLSYGYED